MKTPRTQDTGQAQRVPARRASPRADAAAIDEAAAVEALAALAQPARLRAFRVLVGAGPGGMHPGAISIVLGVPASTLSCQLERLHRAGLVTRERDGRYLLYRPAIVRMNALLGYLAAHCCEGRDCGLQLPSPTCGTG